ncbi:MAG TPA: HAD-IA family hydrolase [Candidatus Binatia bacterium]|jgi:putative hydrolase of the HAD superfamily
MPFKTVFFDAAGTLMRPVRPIGQSYALLAKNYGMNVSGADVARRFHACFSSAPPLAFPQAADKEIQNLERAWWEEVVRRVFEPHGAFSRFDDYFTELFAYFARADSWSLFPETAETLAALKRRGLSLAVISNFDSRLLDILNGLGVSSSFESIVISSRTGYAKPAREIFHQALALHGAKAEEAIHVGDSPDKDAAGATNAGLTGVLLDRKARIKSNSFPRVQNLAGLLPLIDNGK